MFAFVSFQADTSACHGLDQVGTVIAVVGGIAGTGSER
jgi:hypothetical protein